ncbi:hypothetical protein [Alysiella filiformis]|uniref:hypothetical protein n=1 Tax=Alysiella filiformis TaxID=194196 RepID=UPI00117886A1|nr:hypothetical protein [Alysiella filiformis]QMT31493.1 hypothetical protein H3L97_00835 [Alysiella filiformis]UBQ55495.1 hypothetical protein JF568_07840 [Alysiella filiformis DSM 16848]
MWFFLNKNTQSRDFHKLKPLQNCGNVALRRHTHALRWQAQPFQAKPNYTKKGQIPICPHITIKLPENHFFI